ncbi:hemolysin transporter protein shlB, partial [Yersinia pestis PY-91]
MIRKRTALWLFF